MKKKSPICVPCSLEVRGQEFVDEVLVARSWLNMSGHLLLELREASAAKREKVVWCWRGRVGVAEKGLTTRKL